MRFLEETPYQKHRTYRVWRNIELPKYFIKLHLECARPNTVYSIDISPLRGGESRLKMLTDKQRVVPNFIVSGVGRVETENLIKIRRNTQAKTPKSVSSQLDYV